MKRCVFSLLDCKSKSSKNKANNILLYPKCTLISPITCSCALCTTFLEKLIDCEPKYRENLLQVVLDYFLPIPHNEFDVRLLNKIYVYDM